MTRGTIRRFMHGCGVVLAASLCVTETLILMDYGWREALPLHLCGMGALMALAVAFGMDGFALDFLWYLCLPGAAAALIFPAPVLSRYQMLLNASYTATHALIIAIALLAPLAGRMPSRRKGAQMLAALAVIALPVYAVNVLLGTDYLFLIRPPADTPLEWVSGRGYGVYLFCLSAIAVGFSAGMEWALEALFCFGLHSRGARRPAVTRV